MPGQHIPPRAREAQHRAESHTCTDFEVTFQGDVCLATQDPKGRAGTMQ